MKIRTARFLPLIALGAFLTCGLPLLAQEGSRKISPRTLPAPDALDASEGLGGTLPQLPDVTTSLVANETLPVPHCKVAGVIGKEINFELLLPENWNGKFVMGGGGGFVGSVMNTSLMFGSLQAGYATVGTDTGHKGHPLDASWAHNNLERLVNFGHLGVHRTAVTAHALITAYYNKDITYSYFTGCSTGGRQALMEAQRYPEDFDGIVAGAPSLDYVGIGALATQISKAMYPDPGNLEEALIGPEEQKLIESYYLEKYDALDGLKDGILNDPRQCKVDLKDLSNGIPSLSKQQLAALKVVYGGAKDSKGNSLFPGFPFGSENSPGGWSRWLTGGLKYQEDLNSFQGGVEVGDFKAPVSPSAYYGFGNGIIGTFVYNNPKWSYVGYDYDDFREEAERVTETLDAKNPDLSAFRKRGGRLLIYTGWSDAAIPPQSVINYYQSVVAHDKTAAADVRLYMLPGVEHCFGGPGPSFVNWLTEIDKWVVSGTAPEQITVYWLDEKKQPSGSRILCPYPQSCKYDGKGNPRDASSFSCKEAK